MTYNYNSTDLVRATELTEREQFLLKIPRHFVSTLGFIYMHTPREKHILVAMLK